MKLLKFLYGGWLLLKGWEQLHSRFFRKCWKDDLVRWLIQNLDYFWRKGYFQGRQLSRLYGMSIPKFLSSSLDDFIKAKPNTTSTKNESIIINKTQTQLTEHYLIHIVKYFSIENYLLHTTEFQDLAYLREKMNRRL